MASQLGGVRTAQGTVCTAEASPGGRVWAARSVHGSGASAAGSSSPPESHHAQHQRTHSRSGSGGGSGAISRSLFSASEDDASWLVAAPPANGGASDADFSMLEDRCCA